MRPHVIAVSRILLTFFCLTIAFDPTDEQVPESGRANHWFSRFLFNLLGYSVILLPAAVIVICVKKKSCPLQCEPRFCHLIARQRYCCFN